MSGQVKTPATLLAATRQFSDPAVAFEYMKQMRWPNGVKCPYCGHEEPSFLASRQMWQCARGCKKQFSVKKGTIFEESPIGLDKWLMAMWLIANAKNGISSMELHRTLGVTQKTAWFMLHRIRLAMKNGTIEKLGGDIEADEMFVGGSKENMHKDKQKKLPRGGSQGKTVVLGILERGGEVRTKVVRNVRKSTLCSEVEANVRPGSKVYTDALPSYNQLDSNFRHGAVDHQIEFVNGDVHTNGLENFWSLVKRTMSGTYVSVEPIHLSRYLDEYCFRFNNRKANDGDRFEMLSGMISGKRLTYADLTGKVVAAA